MYTFTKLFFISALALLVLAFEGKAVVDTDATASPNTNMAPPATVPAGTALAARVE